MSSRTVIELVRRVRPAPVGAAIAATLRLNKRRVISGKRGLFFAAPVSHLGWSLLEGEYEPSMASVLDRYLYPGAVFVDLGANEGYFSVLASKLVGPFGMVIAVEPQERLQAVIQHNCYLNRSYNVRVIRAVVSGCEGDQLL